jgi:hypothetical protein
VRGIVALADGKGAVVSVDQGERHEWMAKLLRQSAKTVERESDIPLAPRETRPDRLRHFG